MGGLNSIPVVGEDLSGFLLSSYEAHIKGAGDNLKMQLAMYYPWIYLRSGIERTILEICKRSKHSWVIFTHHYNPKQTFSGFQNLKVIQLPSVSVKRDYLSVARSSLRILKTKLNLGPYQGLLVHSEGLGDLITLLNHEVPIVCYCHTPLKVIHDPMARDSYMRAHPFKVPFFLTFAGIFKFIDKYAWRRYDYIFCCNREIKRRILHAKLSAPDKIELLHLGVDTKEFLPSGKGADYFLIPSRIKWWKNIELGIYSFKEFLRCSSRRMELVIAGQLVEGSYAYFEKLKRISRGLPVKFIINPSEGKFRDLIQKSFAVINTTLNEDCGLVILEAMSAGKPVIAVNMGGPKDIIKHGLTGFLVEAHPRAFSEAMLELVRNKSYAYDMGMRARESILKYDWDNFVERIDGFWYEYRERIGKKGGPL